MMMMMRSFLGDDDDDDIFWGIMAPIAAMLLTAMVGWNGGQWQWQCLPWCGGHYNVDMVGNDGCH